jgi:peptide/nickel transport system permease protein
MAALILRRLAAMVVVLLALTAVVFLLRQLTPANPARVALGPRASIGAVEEYSRELGLDKPLVVQYVIYLNDVVHGDFQVSVRTRRAVSEDLAAFVPATMELALYGILFAGVGGILFGILSVGRWRGSGLVRNIMVVGSSLPSFLLAFGLILLFSRQLGWLPGTGRSSLADMPDGPTQLLTIDALLNGRLDAFWNALQHLILPASTIALASAVAIGRVLRSGLHTSLGSDYVRTARAKGMNERLLIRRHALRNASGPALTMGGLQLGLMFAGVVIVEQIFAWRGIGWYTAQSIPTNDFAAIAAVTLILGTVYVVVNTAVDLAQMLADPRIRR